MLKQFYQRVFHQTDVNPDSSRFVSGKVLGMRRSAVFELAIFFLLAFVVDYLFLDGSRFWSWSPHPFWLIVVLLSCQYGSNEGLLAAAVASLVLISGNLPEQTLSQDLYDYLLTILQSPLLWACCAVFLGGLRNRQIEERDVLQAELKGSRHREKKIASAYETMRSLKRKLESRLAGQMQTATTLYKAVSSIEKLEPEEVLKGVVDVLRTLLHPDKFSLYLLEGDQLELSITDGWTTKDEFAHSFSAGSSLFTKIVGERRLACIANEDDEAILGREGVLAGPLVDPESDKVLGMLKIEELGFVELNMESLETFRVVSDWLATTYKNAQKYEVARSRSMVSDKTQLFSYGFFIGHKDFFVDLARRMSFKLSMILVRLENSESLEDEIVHDVSNALKKVVGKALRKTDLAFDHNQTGQEFAVVLPGASLEDATVVSEKLSLSLTEELGALAERVEFSFSTQALFKENRKRHLLSREHFEARLDFLLRLQNRVDVPLVLAAFELKKLGKLVEEDRFKVSGLYRKTFGKYLADRAEVCFAYQRSDSLITMVIPSETIDTAQRIADEVTEAVEHEIGVFDVELNYSIHLISPPDKPEVFHAQQTWKEAERIFSAPN